MKRPIINVEKKIDRVVGRRTQAPNGLSTVTSNKSQSVAWQKAMGGLRVPRGVYRFKTHEEADSMDDQNAGAKRDVRDLESDPSLQAGTTFTTAF